MVIYKGFSTVNAPTKNFVLTDAALINQDLQNQFNTRRGSRVMQPGLGCIAWELLFEPMTRSQQNDLISDITDIVNSDPRVTLQSVAITTGENSITATLQLFYTQLNLVGTLAVTFTQAATSATFT